MLQKVILLSFFCVFPTNALAAVPSTPEEWAEFHNSCMRCASMAAQQKGWPVDMPANYCACMENEFHQLAADDRLWDESFKQLDDYCLAQARRTR